MESVTRASFWGNLENMIGFAIKRLLIQVGNDLLKHTSDATWDNINNMSHERNILIVRRVILVLQLLFAYNSFRVTVWTFTYVPNTTEITRRTTQKFILVWLRPYSISAGKQLSIWLSKFNQSVAINEREFQRETIK